MEKFKALPYQTKSTIFLVLSVLIGIVAWITDNAVGDLAANILWGIGLFYWGAQYAQWRARRSAAKQTVLG